MNIFVFGWYDQGNLGDEVFKLSFNELWSSVNFTFGNEIPSNINTYDALWIGGGSFLDQPIYKIDTVTIPLCFIGVGVSAAIPLINQQALKRAKRIICRDKKLLDNLPVKDNATAISDLVFARTDLQPLHHKKTRQITVLLNDFVTPIGVAVPEWRSLSYSWFLQEFSKILDRFAAQDYKIKLLPMCINPRVDDRRIAAAIIGRSIYPHRYDWQLNPVCEFDLRAEISKSAFVLTQRFHGLVYSIIEECPCLAICTHDKFNSLVKELDLPSVDYYGLTDVVFTDKLKKVLAMQPVAKDYVEKSRLAWQTIAAKRPLA